MRENPEMVRAWRRQSYRNQVATPEGKERLYAAKQKTYPKDKRRIMNRKRLYGITNEQYEQLLQKQNNTCFICQAEHTFETPLVVDHCHETKAVRGLLCKHCNLALGKFNDSISRLKKAIEYLEK